MFQKNSKDGVVNKKPSVPDPQNKKKRDDSLLKI